MRAFRVVFEFAHIYLIDEHIDVVPLRFGERDALAELLQFPIDLHRLVPFAEQVVQELIVFAFATDDDRGEHANLLGRDGNAHHFRFLCGFLHFAANLFCLHRFENDPEDLVL